MKNRFPDILPYDHSRVPLPCTKDDYINASFVNNLSLSSMPFIATQLPLASTKSDFWQMIWHHQIELMVCLCSDLDVSFMFMLSSDFSPYLSLYEPKYL